MASLEGRQNGRMDMSHNQCMSPSWPGVPEAPYMAGCRFDTMLTIITQEVSHTVFVAQMTKRPWLKTEACRSSYRTVPCSGLKSFLFVMTTSWGKRYQFPWVTSRCFHRRWQKGILGEIPPLVLTVQCSEVQCSIVYFNAVQGSTLKYCAVQQSILLQCFAVHCNTVTLQ